MVKESKSGFAQGYEMGVGEFGGQAGGVPVFDMTETFKSISESYQSFITGIQKEYEATKVANEAANTDLRGVADKIELQLANGTYSDDNLETLWMPQLEQYRERIKNIKGKGPEAEKERLYLFNEMGKFLNAIESGDNNKFEYLQHIRNGTHNPDIMGEDNLLFTTALANNSHYTKIENGQIFYSAKITPLNKDEKQYSYTANDGTVYEEWIPQHILEEIVSLKDNSTITANENIILNSAKHAAVKGNDFKGYSGDAKNQILNTYTSKDAFRNNINNIFSGNSERGSYVDALSNPGILTEQIFLTLNNNPDLINKFDVNKDNVLDETDFANTENWTELTKILKMDQGVDNKYFGIAKEIAADWHLNTAVKDTWEKNKYTKPVSTTPKSVTYGTSNTVAFTGGSKKISYSFGGGFKTTTVNPDRLNTTMGILDNPQKGSKIFGWDERVYEWDHNKNKWAWTNPVDNKVTYFAGSGVSQILGLQNVGYMPSFNPGQY